jgi:hypothetical protein
MTQTVTGACFCGAVRFEADLPADAVAHCHCGNCRRALGSAFNTFATFPPERFRLVAGADDLSSYLSEAGSTWRFCRTCGSTLLYESPGWPGVTVTVASLLDPLDRAPEAHYHADRAPDWSPILDDLPRFGGPTGVEPLA